MSLEHEPTPALVAMVEAYATVGTPQAHIATLIGVSEPTLRKHYREQLDAGAAKAGAAVLQTLFGFATRKYGTAKEQLTAAIFFAKTKLGFSETLRHADADGKPLNAPLDLAALDDEQLAALLALARTIAGAGDGMAAEAQRPN